MTLEQLIGKEAVKEIVGKPFGINTNARYSEKEFNEHASKLFDIEKIQSELEEESPKISTLERITSLALEYMPGNPEANRKLLEKPRNALNQARVLYATGTKKMAEYMGNNLSTVLKEMNDKHVADFALTISGELNKYLEMEMLLKQGKVKEAKAVLISLHNSKEWREFASGFTQRDIAMYAPIAIEAAKKKFIAANFGKIEKNKDRVEEAIPNYKKARSYITKVIGNLGDSKEDKAKKQAIYMNLARALYMQKQNGNKPTVDFAEEYPMMEYY